MIFACMRYFHCAGKTDMSCLGFANVMGLHGSLCGLLIQPAVRVLKHQHRRHREVGNSYTQ